MKVVEGSEMEAQWQKEPWNHSISSLARQDLVWKVFLLPETTKQIHIPISMKRPRFWLSIPQAADVVGEISKSPRSIPGGGEPMTQA